MNVTHLINKTFNTIRSDTKERKKQVATEKNRKAIEKIKTLQEKAYKSHLHAQKLKRECEATIRALQLKTGLYVTVRSYLNEEIWFSEPVIHQEDIREEVINKLVSKSPTEIKRMVAKEIKRAIMENNQNE